MTFNILGVTFDSMMSFEKHLSSVSSAASQRLSILRKSWRPFHERCFRDSVMPILDYCSTVIQITTHYSVVMCWAWPGTLVT